jgi:flagella basal body P-ring formation protein FlgA
MIRKLAIATAALLALGAAAAAADLAPEHPKLKAEAVITGGIVRIGDLVDHAGIIARVPIFRAPDLGVTGTVSAEAVIEAVRPYALVGLDTGDIAEVTVTRASRMISAKTIEEIVAQALAAQYALGPVKDIVLHFERELRAVHVEPSAKGEPRIAYLNFDSHNGRFDVTLDMPAGAGSHGTLHLIGRAAATAEVVTLLRPVERGEVIGSADVVVERRPRADVGRDLIKDIDHAVGLAARSAMQPGKLLRIADLTKPEVVQRNESVTLVYKVPGITLTVRGKATEGGAQGDVISVLNEQSKRTVQGVVAGPGRVVVSSSTPQLAANLPVRR